MPLTARSGSRLHYIIIGNKSDLPPLVLVHGLGANLSFWYKQIGHKLAQYTQIIMYDLRGHGYSDMPVTGYSIDEMAEDLRHLSEVISIDRFHLAGHSYGARIALLFSTRYPHKVVTLTIADTQLTALQPPIRLKDWPYWPYWKELLEINRIGRMPSEEAVIDFNLLNHLNRLSGPDSAHINARDLKSLSMKSKGARKWEKLLATTTAALDFENQDLLSVESLKKLRMPMVCLYGELSHCLPTSFAMAELLDNCEVEVIPSVGHFHPALEPKYFIDSVTKLLQREPGVK